MKHPAHNVLGALLIAGSLITVTPTFAQTAETVETVITSEGTVSEFGPQLLIIKSETAVTTVKSGLPVTLHYTKVGDTLMVSKVIVRKAVVVPPPVVETKKTTTTTTTDKK